jgi:hypothetical protein
MVISFTGESEAVFQEATTYLNTESMTHLRGELEELTSLSHEGRMLFNPTKEIINDLFLQISNYKFQSTPLILETFN